MKCFVMTLLATTALTLGCSDSDEPLRGWKESDVEVVNEGTATGTTRQVIVSGEGAPPMTATAIDTTTDLDMITDQQLGLDPAGTGTTIEDSTRTLADQLGTGAARSPGRTTTKPDDTSDRPVRAETRTEPTSSPRTAPPSPAREPRPRPESDPEPDPVEPEQEPLPPIVTPPMEPEPPVDEGEPQPEDPPTDTSSTDQDPPDEQDR